MLVVHESDLIRSVKAKGINHNEASLIVSQSIKDASVSPLDKVQTLSFLISTRIELYHKARSYRQHIKDSLRNKRVRFTTEYK